MSYILLSKIKRLVISSSSSKACNRQTVSPGLSFDVARRPQDLAYEVETVGGRGAEEVRHHHSVTQHEYQRVHCDCSLDPLPPHTQTTHRHWRNSAIPSSSVSMIWRIFTTRTTWVSRFFFFPRLVASVAAALSEARTLICTMPCLIHYSQ